ncbi:MAG: hypothetical protein LQ345_002020 [Seirophora villosa]|nr:MAG: hypothetical protein LQ345_002020 [Seirophora villosa]
MGQHQELGSNGELIHTPELTAYEKCRYVDEVFTTLNCGVVKISILFFYRRLFPVRPFKIASGIMLAVVASWAISFTSAMVAQCSPPYHFWTEFEKDYPQHCIQVQVMYLGLAYSDLILDVLVLALPIPTVASLHLPWKTKIKVLDVLMLGSVVLASGIARLVSFQQVIGFTNKNPEAFLKDTPWYSAGPLFWIFAENAIAIIGACLPTLAPLWSKEQHGSITSGWPEKKSWKSIFPKKYMDLEDSGHHDSNGPHASHGQLVGLGPTTVIRSDGIPLEDTPHGGIKVQTTQSIGYAR